MKRILFVLIFNAQFIYTMNEPRLPSLMKSQIYSLLHKKSSLTEKDIQKTAAQLIKKIRAQSPSSAFAYNELLKETLIDLSIGTDSFLTPCIRTTQETLRRDSSPLITTDIID